MPFAYACRLVSGDFQRVGHGDFGSRKPWGNVHTAVRIKRAERSEHQSDFSEHVARERIHPGDNRKGHARPVRIPAGQQSGPRRRTYGGAGVEVGKLHSLLRQAVDVRGLDCLASEAA